ncbi:MAG: hypothetical protein A2W03_05860 [Candidatus Aminicenantes bacterium RBG_16_63_16]|nr:MAG: hypothetical protein A2W03_05860 [Candidatus Aminicenantes bacterium RBG_16_63_16]
MSRRLLGFSLIFLFIGPSLNSGPAAERKGLWLLSRKDPTNSARADIAGRMLEAPVEVWRTSTGADVHFAVRVTVDGKEAVLVLAGRSLALMRPDGTAVWRLDRQAVRQVVRLDDFDGLGKTQALVFRGSRSISLLDLATGATLWDWTSPPSSNNVLCRFLRSGRGLRLLTFPNYSTLGVCFDFSGDARQPRVVWQKDYSDKYTKGYGPSFILADLDGDRAADILLSSKLEGDSGRGSLYQAVIDPDTGSVKSEGHLVPDASAPLPLGRPYGLLQSADLDGDGRREIVLVSCQVEEYASVTGLDGRGRIRKLWAHFVEKDWPVDDRELRPQVTSLADVDGDGRPELVLGLWDAGNWATLVLDPLKGFDPPKARLAGYYFWGNFDLDGDGSPEIVCSRESRRAPGRVTTLAAISGRTLKPEAELNDAAVFTSSDSELGEDIHFMANRGNPVFVTSEAGRAGIVVRLFRERRESGVYFWGAKRGEAVAVRRIAEGDFGRLDWRMGKLLLSTRRGGMQVFDGSLVPLGNLISASGRTATPLVWEAGGKREVVFDEAGGIVRGVRAERGSSGAWKNAWTVAGTLPSLHIDGRGTGRLSAADLSDPDRPAVLVYEAPVRSDTRPRRITVEFAPFIGLLPYGEEFRLLVDLRTGVHTNAFACFDAAGRLAWRDSGHGAYPRLAAAGDITGDGAPEAVADDHGDLRIYDSDGRVIGSNIKKTWQPPAYLLPILGPFLADGRPGILGVSGFGGLTLHGPSGAAVWKKTGGDWEYYRSYAAIGYPEGPGRPALAALTEAGVLQGIDAVSGRVLWSLDLGCAADETYVAGGDVDGDGRDEYLVGLPDGRLVSAGAKDGRGVIEWEKRLEAAIGPLAVADADGDGLAEVVLGTADGAIRILKSRPESAARGRQRGCCLRNGLNQ